MPRLAEGERSGIGTAGRVLALGAIIAAAVIVAFILFSGDGGYQVTARFQNAAQLVPGNEVYVGGVPAGSVKDIKITHDGQADVKFELLGQVRAAAPGHPRDHQADLAVGHRQPLRRRRGRRRHQPGDRVRAGGSAPSPPRPPSSSTQLFNLFDPVARVAVQDFFEGSDKMIQGKGQELQRGIKYLNPTLSTSRRLFKELTRDERLLARFLIDSGRLTETLSDRRTELTGLVRNLNGTFTALASQKGALAESIDRLPPFMRRANTTFVNLRAALDDVDPLVDASKPVAERLQPFLREARGLAADGGAHPARPLAHHQAARARSNDLIELVNSFPPLASTALDTKTINGARRRGAFPETSRGHAPLPAHRGDRPARTPTTWSAGSTTSRPPAPTTRWAASRARASTSTRSSATRRRHPAEPRRARRSSDSFKKCPGAAEVKLPDRTNVPTAEEQSFLDCREADRPVRGRRRVRRIVASVVVLALVAAGAFVLTGASGGSEHADLQARVRQRLRPHPGRRLQDRRRARRADQPVLGLQGAPAQGGRRGQAEPEGRRQAARGLPVRHQAAVADRRVLRGLPRGQGQAAHRRRHAAASAAPARRSRSTWSTTSCACPTASACA